MMAELKERGFEKEFTYRASRSSGPGGQNVNKVNTRVELIFHIESSKTLSDDEKDKIRTALKGKINADDELIIASQASRSQFKNKSDAEEKFYLLLGNALRKRKKRIATRRTKASAEKRLSKKKRRSEIKKYRKNPGN